MLINESYFDDLDIKDEDIVVDDDNDDNDVEEPQHELTIDKLFELPEQYNHLIRFRIEVDDDRDTTFIQTSLLPRIFKRLNTIFEMYGIEHSQYILTSMRSLEGCDTIVEFGDYQLFCEEDEKDEYINDTYDGFFLFVYVNYPKFTYKKAFRFLYTVLNLYRIDEQITQMDFKSITTNDYVTSLYFKFDWFNPNDIIFQYYDYRTRDFECEIDVCNVEYLTEEQKRLFYNSVFRHFFKKEIRIPYKSIERDVPLKSYIR